jgi:hypothetical protein
MNHLGITITMTWLFAVLAWFSTLIFMAGVAGMQVRIALGQRAFAAYCLICAKPR